MATLAQLTEWRTRLQESRYGGLREVRDSNGESVFYKSDSEMARALAAIDAEIESMHRRPASRILPQTSKGL
ncbi:phage head-tail joining protein [Rhodovulum steppense]|uniref:GpW protein n=1 Tax=Rhodovulum steppense TaxID=540251 RepID=A0A4R1YVM3_9RHOB|nr:hypothetical protein [Rhodovulum steppense]TCM85170.1 hypothetical protein EV216_10821 [Rhodovulum steppense]